MTGVYFESLTPSFRASAGPLTITEEEIIEFGTRFDPQPFHVDPVAAKHSVFGGLVAPGCLVFALRSKLMNQLDTPIVYLAGLGLETMDLPHPVKPGDQLSLTISCIDRRDSQSHADAGIVRLANTLVNQRGEVVLSMIAKVMVAKHPI
jgi:acyl dehydratase